MRCFLAQLSGNQKVVLRQLLNSYRKRVNGLEKLMRISRRITETWKGEISRGREEWDL